MHIITDTYAWCCVPDAESPHTPQAPFFNHAFIPTNSKTNIDFSFKSKRNFSYEFEKKSPFFRKR